MKGSLRIAKIFGIPVQVHWSFTLLFLFVIYAERSQDGSWMEVLMKSLFILALFTCVVLHEFGHALSALYYGVKTQDITILPIGGVARLNHLPKKPFQEFVVAIAGPAVNAVIYSILALLLHFQYEFPLSPSLMMSINPQELDIPPLSKFLVTLTQANLVLVIFNMIPAFPMDGGRVLRALLSMPLSRVKATKIAVFLGQIIAVGLFIYALLPGIIYLLDKKDIYFAWFERVNWHFQPVLALISGFVFYFARVEYQDVKLEEQLERLRNFTVSDILQPTFTKFQTSDPIHSAIQESTQKREINFLVFDDDNILRGVLQEADIKDAKKHKDFGAMISTYTTLDFEKTSLDENLKVVYEKMYRKEQYMLPVMESAVEGEAETVLGVVDLTAIEIIMK
jgi:Zn-dependent protease